ncbi:hypothetical protein NKDENANG_01025 [Candidatus Entotheonellaceae bacterium PAL068K]
MAMRLRFDEPGNDAIVCKSGMHPDWHTTGKGAARHAA